MLDFRRITLFCLEKRLSKHKMTMFSKNWGGMAPLDPLATAMIGHSLKIWAPLSNLFATPDVPSWLRACSRSSHGD